MLKRIVIAVFAMILCLPMMGQVIGSGSDISTGENRALAPLPPAPDSIKRLQAWPGRMDAWLTDHFGFRSDMTALAGEADYHGRLSPGSRRQVLNGRDGWLYLNEDGILPDHAGRYRPGVQEEAESLIAAYEATLASARESGASAMMAILPNKISIYPEHLPDFVPSDERGARLSALEPLLAGRSDIVSLREDLLAAKDEGQLYYRLDTHWNRLGAWHGYRAIMDAWRAEDDSVPVTLPSAVRFEPFTREGGDLIRMRGQGGPEGEDSLRAVFTPPLGSTYSRVDDLGGYGAQTIIVDTANTDGPTLLILGDSYAEVMLPFFEPGFSRIVLVHHQNGRFDPRTFEVYRSDYVLIATVERLMSGGWGAYGALMTAVPS